MRQAGHWVALWDSWALGRVVCPGAEVLGDAHDVENGEHCYAHADYCLSAEMLPVSSWSVSDLERGDRERGQHRVNAADSKMVAWAGLWLPFLTNLVCFHLQQSSVWDHWNSVCPILILDSWWMGLALH